MAREACGSGELPHVEGTLRRCPEGRLYLTVLSLPQAVGVLLVAASFCSSRRRPEGRLYTGVS